MVLPDESLQQMAWLTAAEQQAWRAVHRLRGPLIGALGRQMAIDSGLSMPDYEVLVALSESADAAVHVRDLLRSTDWEASRLSHHLTRMQVRGLVGRQPCPQDGRSSEVFITDAGRTAIEQAAPAHVAAVRAQFIGLLTPAQLATLADIGQLVADRLEADQPGSSSTHECGLGAV
ncbi:MAG: MarR family winged helix-turn-helix transcriptional regulator [Actinomycetota bacterium]|nr:MarR family winged helix-turn-helix transcriptional regulator [Actinomycetota bacterium]